MTRKFFGNVICKYSKHANKKNICFCCADPHAEKTFGVSGYFANIRKVGWGLKIM